ncbi:MAG: diacylglycerol kinase family lipid kinase, partial [Candidatus Latescibacteria bacterium]|nr:diacylglycerol kinase family lipid kinase [Candidatus Latescibacterota bacterium]
GYDSVYAAGGDGTINEVASGLVNRNVPLGIIPLGTGNGLARGLGIPLDIDRVLRMLRDNRVEAIDVGKISSRFFFSTAGIGYDAAIADDFNRKRKTKTGKAMYFFHAVKNYFSLRAEQVTFVADGVEMKRTVFGLSFCNTRQYGSGAVIAPEASPKSGSLVAVLIPRFSIFKALPMVFRLFDGTIGSCPDIEYITFRKLTVRRHSPGIFQYDGETDKGETTLNISVIPGALKIIVPGKRP